MTAANILDSDDSGDDLDLDLDIVQVDRPRDGLETFATLLFSRVAPEDLLVHKPRELSDLAASAWEFLANRTPGKPKIRITQPPPSASGSLRTTSIIEIINDDMPFLVDSVMGELNERRAKIRLVAHPVISAGRDIAGKLTMFGIPGPGVPGQRESFIHVHVDRLQDDKERNEIISGLVSVLADVRRVVEDWKPMLGRVRDVIADLKMNPPPIPVDEIAEAIQFLEWVVANNFTMMGVRDYLLTEDESDYAAQSEGSLGLLRSQDFHVLRRGNDLAAITPEIMEFLREPRVLIIAKANVRSRIHRRVYLDYIGVKRFSPDGRLVGEFRLVGLFTSTAYTHQARSIPYLRRKVDRVLRRAGFPPEGHLGKALVNVLETYPRDELFQIDDDQLYDFAQAVLYLDERPRVRVLARHDRFERFVSVLVFVPRERYDSAVHTAVGKYLVKAYHGRLSAFYPYYTEGPLVRIHYIIGRSTGETPDIPRAELEAAVVEIVRTWMDRLNDAIAVGHEPSPARQLWVRYRTAFSAAYREAYSPDTAVSDIKTLEHLTAERPLAVNFHGGNAKEEGIAALKVWSFDKPLPLSERVPVLENMGFRIVDEHTYHVQPAGAGAPDFWLHDMMLERANDQSVDIGALKARLETAFIMVMRGIAENDGYNALVQTAGLGWRDIALVRSISRYLRQIRVPFSQDYMWATLVKHPAIAEKIVNLFHARFGIDEDLAGESRAEQERKLLAEIEGALQNVASLDEDRILRRFVNAVTSALRTNFFQRDPDGRPKQTIAIKFDCQALDGVPLPRPLYEIFVYSPRVEGIHLRFGKVARGGIRWSDRPQDFRTEILGLVKAQQVKNAVIVPVGAKGGFVPKRLPVGGTRDAIQAEGVAAYKIFISTLLELTDNLDQKGLVPPPDVVRHDGDDPYLVVAADKGTATFSDIANGLSQEHHFWLDDAFASGGSAGYDHKKMGITARGAWESVKRHFREMDIDISKTPFTVVGVGDMSGDVFGNGMLRENTIKLVAAFDHRDIFIDPSPDPVKSLAERQRMFDLPRSSWQDYDKALISQGGGVFSRALKEIDLSPQAQAVLGIKKAKTTPQEIMSAILKAPVDLLYFGGIGTYIRASNETDDAAGDRANDAIRVTGADLRCKVIGEGANLGMTQLSRIEAALHGVRLNTDAIDNSAGVNTSDIEVNIKIALSRPERDGRLTRADRDKLLAEMTDDVGQLVLRNNYQQTLALSLAQRHGMDDLGFEQRLMQTLEARGRLDRTVEFLPDDTEIEERRRRSQPLTRPELAVMLAYAKLSLYDELLASSVPDDPYLGREVFRYFPPLIAERFPDALEHHRLRREIIATQLANSMINRGGPALSVRIADQTGATSDRIAAAFAAVRNSFDMPMLNTAIDGRDNKISGEMQLSLYAAVQDLLLDRIVWFLRNVDMKGGLASVVDRYHKGIAEVAAVLDSVLAEDTLKVRAERVEQLGKAGVAEPLARRIADLPSLAVAPDIVLVADRAQKSVADVAATYFANGAYFRLDRIVAAAREIRVTDYFDRLALDRSLNGIEDAQRRLTADMMTGGLSGNAAVEAWVKPRSVEVERIRMAVHEIAASGLTLSKLAVASSMLGDLVKG
ncbi:MAG: NAD-glutamate dehydrogenase [Xanthobacteraceae bacterium]